MKRGATVCGCFIASAALACSHALLRDPPLSHRASATPCVAHPTVDGGSTDECTIDDQCGAGRVCSCFAANNPRSSGNVCSSPGNCRVDADCPSERVCTASYSLTCGHPLAITYACHTPDDDCNNDSECTGPGVPGTSSICAFQPDRGKWACEPYGCEGRMSDDDARAVCARRACVVG